MEEITGGYGQSFRDISRDIFRVIFRAIFKVIILGLLF